MDGPKAAWGRCGGVGSLRSPSRALPLRRFGAHAHRGARASPAVSSFCPSFRRGFDLSVCLSAAKGAHGIESGEDQPPPHRPHAAFGPSIDRTPPHRLRATVMPEKPLQHDPGLGRLSDRKAIPLA